MYILALLLLTFAYVTLACALSVLVWGIGERILYPPCRRRFHSIVNATAEREAREKRHLNW